MRATASARVRLRDVLVRALVTVVWGSGLAALVGCSGAARGPARVQRDRIQVSETNQEPSMETVTWKRLSAERPAFSPDGLLMREPAEQRIVYVSRDAAWAFGSDHRWTRLDAKLPEIEGVRAADPVVGWTTTSGHAIVGRLTSGSLAVFALAGPDELTTYAFDGPHPSGGQAAAFVQDGIVHVHASNNAGQTWVLDGDRFVEVARGPHLLDLAVDGARQQAIGYDVHRNLYAFTGNAWSRVGRLDRSCQGLAWHPSIKSLVTFLADGDESMRLHGASEDATPIEPAVRAPAYRNGGHLEVGADGTVVYFGGQDFSKSGSYTDETFFASTGQSKMSSDMRDDPPPMGRYGTLVTTADRFVLVNHSTLDVTTPDGDDWAVFAGPAQPADAQPFSVRDDRFVNFTAWGDRVWMLDGDGDLWEAKRGGVFRRLGGGKPGPGERYSNRIALAFDAKAQQVVAYGGVDRNDTWVFDLGAAKWKEIRPPGPPPHGIASVVMTPAGIYALIESELWRYDDQRWTCVGKDISGTHLMFDPKRNGLLTAGWEPGRQRDPKQAIWAWTPKGARMLQELPAGVRLASAYSGGAYIAIDPAGDRVLVLGEDSGAFSLALGELGLEPAELPTTPIEPPTTRLPTPPSDWTRHAAELVRTKTKLPAVPKLGVEIQGELIAILTADPKALPLPRGYGALAISVIETWYEHGDAYQPWNLGGGGYYATLIPDRVVVEPCIIERGVAYRLRMRPFTEIDPEHVLEVDTPPDNTGSLSYGSKVGGYPQLIQDDPTERWDGPPLRFAVQLAGDLYEVGDWGKTYAWLSDDPPRGYIVMQSH